MKLRTAAMWALFGTTFSSAVAMAVPMPSSTIALGPKAQVVVDPIVTPEALSRFTAGQTLTMDARLGHASIPRSGSGETFLFASVVGGDAASTQSAPMNLAIVIDRSGSMKGERIA